ncbi:MAG: hypothetical protein HKO66_13550 [Saprospiraceae bacterium]|nr:hypothetical protein [Bacteroidia bacterium]NNE15075.1 hypothetical protein [Saprospiraceae bacterium]NNL93260.1 hypothetical protein [Saprospiraceae bacterium]
MNRNEMYLAIKALREGISFEETGLINSIENLIQWQELKNEIYEGYSIDLPREIRA